MSEFNEMSNAILKFNISINKLKRIKCKGVSCSAINGVGHSKECELEINSHYVSQAPKCFERAGIAGRFYDNCRYCNTCKSVKPICWSNPISEGEE